MIRPQAIFCHCMPVCLLPRAQVRDSGVADMQTLERKVNEMVDSMNQQTRVIEQLNIDLRNQKQVQTGSIIQD